MLRYSFIPLLFLPAVAFADDFALRAPVRTAEIYPQAAIVTREADYSIPAGRHRLILTDVFWQDDGPLKIDLGEGVALISSQIIESEFPSQDFFASPQLVAAKATVEAARQAKRALEVERADAQAQIEAANARIEFARKLGQAEGVPSDQQALNDIADVVGTVVSEAIKTRTAAEHKIEALEFPLEAAEIDVGRAEEALNALYSDYGLNTKIVLTVAAGADAKGKLTVTHVAAAGWTPLYEVRVTTGDTPTLQLERRIGVFQSTGEPWSDVSVSFSTLSMSKQLDAYEPEAWLRHIEKPAPQPELSRMTMADAAVGLEAPVIIEEKFGAVRMNAEVMGMDIRYTAPQPLDLPSTRYDSEVTQVDLDRLEFTIDDLHAIAVPLNYETAFLRAKLTNTSGEVLLPGDATFYRDGLVAGTGQFPLLVQNASEEIGLGEIRGLILERRIADKMTGDTGVISKSNEQTEEATLLVTNQTDRAWDVRLMDRVPYSEQEDLKITWSADPMPSETDIDGKRGVLGWRKPVAAGEEWRVTLRHRIVWPENQVLR